MAIDGSLGLWGSNGPVVWHSETSGLGYWYAGGIYSDYKAADGGVTAKIPWWLFYRTLEAI